MNEEFFSDWLLHPVTKAFHRHLQERREGILDLWSRGGFQGDTEFKNACLQAAGVRECQVLSDLLSLTVQDLVDGME